MTPATPPVLYISADTSDLTTRYKATPRMHMGADAWGRLPTMRDCEAFMDAVWAALKADANDLRKQQRIARALHVLVPALAALPAPDEGEQDEGE